MRALRNTFFKSSLPGIIAKPFERRETRYFRNEKCSKYRSMANRTNHEIQESVRSRRKRFAFSPDLFLSVLEAEASIVRRLF